MTTGLGNREALAVVKPQRGIEFWRAALDRHQASGLSQREFCEREGLALSTFALWSRRIRDEGDDDGSMRFVERRALASKVGLSNVSNEPGLHVRLDLGGGLVLEIRRG